MAVEHAMFKFEDLKVNSHYDRQTEWQPKCLALAHAYTCGETNYFMHNVAQAATESCEIKYAEHYYCEDEVFIGRKQQK